MTFASDTVIWLSERGDVVRDYSAGEREWLIPVTLVVTVQILLWLIAFIAGRVFPPMLLGYGAVTFLGLALVVSVRLLIWRRRLRLSGAKLPPLVAAVRANFPRLLAIVAGLQLVIIGSAAFSALKAAMPKTVSFWLDPSLASAEQLVFGMHPWQISHALFGWATPAIDQFYATFVPVHVIAVLAVLTAPPSGLKARALISLALSWLIVGTGGAYLLSSAGPIFYDQIFGGRTYADLTAVLEIGAPVTVKTAGLLWHFHEMDMPVIANGISAMPSMHVGLTLWLALVLRHTSWARLAWVYFGLIWLGSVHLGWHYASDGLIASVAVLLIWKVTPALSFKDRSPGLRSGPVEIAPVATRSAAQAERPF